MKRKIEQLKPIEKIPNEGFLGISCCSCGSRHVYHFRVDRGITPEQDIIVISHFRDWNYEKIRRSK